MTKDDIIRMAREAGMPDPMVFFGAYERFAALVAIEEREACAKVCDESAARLFGGKSRVNQVDRHTAEVLRGRADAIRARGKK